MHILIAMVVGGIVGALASLAMPGDDPGRPIVTALLGVAGSIVANFIGQGIDWYRPGFTTTGILLSTLGALILLFAYRLVVTRHRTV